MSMFATSSTNTNMSSNVSMNLNVDFSNLTSAFDNVSPMSVIIGRGRKIREHPGNQRFYGLVRSCLNAYATAPTKTKKSLIILKILNDVRSAANNEANFVKLDPNTGEYYPVEESAARITIAQALRDSLNEHYKSSKQHKQRRRLLQKRATAFSAAAAKNNHQLNLNLQTLQTASCNFVATSASSKVSTGSISTCSSASTLSTSSCNNTGTLNTSELIQRNTNMMEAMQMNNMNSVNSLCLNSILQDIQPVVMSRPGLARQVSVGSINSSSSSNLPMNAKQGPAKKMLSLRSILDEAVGIAKAPAGATARHQEEEETVMDDVFSSLFKAFGPAPQQEQLDLFEPTPIAEPAAAFSDNASYGSLEDDWEPFPLNL